jgi:hypothetical protein
VLTSAANPILLQGQQKSAVTDNFEFHGTRNGTRAITTTIEDFQQLNPAYLAYFTFYPKSQKPLKAVICPLPLNTPAEDFSSILEGPDPSTMPNP